MRPCPVCASSAEENDIYCGVCGTNFEIGTEEVDPISTATTRAAVEAAQTPRPPEERRPSFYLPALQFLLAVALLGYLLSVTSGYVPAPTQSRLEELEMHEGDLPICPSDGSLPGHENGCPIILKSGWTVSVGSPTSATTKTPTVNSKLTSLIPML